MEINFEDCRTSRMPDDKDRNFGWTIKRAGTDSVMKLVVLSSDIFGIRTHFFRGRTGPCLLSDCEACEHKQLSRWKGYLLAVDASDQQQCIFEFTPPAALKLDEAKKKYGTLRGLQVYVSRASKKPNAKVNVTVRGISVLGPQECPDYWVWPVLAHIWGLNSKESLDVHQASVKDLSQYEKS